MLEKLLQLEALNSDGIDTWIKASSEMDGRINLMEVCHKLSVAFFHGATFTLVRNPLLKSYLMNF